MTREPQTWPEEARVLLPLGMRVTLVHLGQRLLSTVDAMMLGRVSELALASGALAATVAIALLIFPLGTLMVLDPLVAQAHGAGDRTGLARHWLRGVILAIVLSLPVALCFWFMEPVLLRLGQKPDVALMAGSYLRALAPSALPFLVAAALRQTLQARGVTRPALWAIAVMNVVNIAANTCLIFGKAGFPALGVVGSGVATTISRYVGLGVLAVLGWRWFEFDRRALSGAWRQVSAYTHMLRIGLPVGAHNAIEMWFFAAVALMMGALGARELAGHQISINLVAMFFMVPFGLASAAAARVGHGVGRGDMPAARRSARVALAFGALVMLVGAAVFAGVPRLLASLYTEDAAVIGAAAVLLPVAAVFQLFDGVQVVASGILRGLADTRWPAAVAFLGYWVIGIPIAYWLGVVGGAGPRGLWWGLTAGLAIGALLLGWRVYRLLRRDIDRLALC